MTKVFLSIFRLSVWQKLFASSVAAAVFASVLFGCRGQKPSHPILPPNADSGDIVLQDETYKTDFGNYAAHYGTIQVPRDYAADRAGSLQLHFVRIPAQNPSGKTPIFYLTGGPGLSNLTFQPFPALLEQRDFVMVGYRGIDDNAPLMCLSVQEAMSGKKDALGAETRAALAEAFSACANELAGRGVDLGNYTIREVIADIEAVRRALGYDKINLLSESYGTRIAYFYALHHPEVTTRSVMLGANPPGRFIFEKAKIQQQLEYYAELWAQAEDNPEREVDLLASMQQALDDAPSRWLIFPIDVGKVKMATFLMLFHRQSAAMIFDAYLAAARGDASGLAVMTFAYDMLLPSALNYADVAAKAVSADYDSSRNFVSEMAAGPTLLGSPHAQLLWGSLQQSNWPKTVLPEAYTTLQPSDTETLILSGNIDFSTPAEYAADDLLPFLKNGRQLVVAEAGHTVDLWTLDNAATISTILRFFEDGSVDDNGIPYMPMSFAVGLGFPGAAKLAVAVVFLGILFVTFLIAFLIYRLRQN